MHTKGSITAECCICSVIIVFALLLSIQLIGYAKANFTILQDLESELRNAAVTYHISDIYLLNPLKKDRYEYVENIRTMALPYEYFFTMSARSVYTGVLANNNMHVKAISPKWKGDGIGAAQCNIWDLNPFERGDVIHQIMGANLDTDFPVLDKYDEFSREAVSIISINTQDSSYLSGTDMKKKIKQQIDAIDSYTIQSLRDVTIDETDIEKKKVLVVIPNEALNKRQRKQIDEMTRYADSLDIELEIKKFQGASD
ncbi:MAG: hypothetical protein PHV04_02845 [Clostridia bacterium]|nr:hypothetical protein [Clostridia bacterium]